MEKYHILVTDYIWKDLNIEQKILAAVGAELIAAETGEEEELLELAPQADGIFTNWKPVRKKVIEQADRCRCICRYGIGLDNIDVSFATESGIVVTNVPSYCIEEVSDHALALLLAWARKVVVFDRAMQKGRYDLPLGMPMFRLKGKTLGLAGFGKIGKAVCRKARSLGLETIAFDPYLTAEQTQQEQTPSVSFQELLEQSDFISIHAPLTPETEKMFDAAAFKRMKETSFLINTSRGALVDTDALCQALDSGQLAGAALDVLPQEPPPPDDPLGTHPGVLITPHAAFNSEESLIELRSTVGRQMEAVLRNKRPEAVVNPDVLEQPNLRVQFEEK